MAFKDLLAQAIEANGGKTPANLDRIADLARKVQPDFTPRYIAMLLMGRRPRPEDFQALAAAIGIPPSELVEDGGSILEDNVKKAKEFASSRMKRPDLADVFAAHVARTGKFNKQDLAHNDLYVYFNDLLQTLDDDGDIS